MQLRLAIAAIFLMPIFLVRADINELRLYWKKLAVLSTVNSVIPFFLLAFLTLFVSAGFAAILNATARLEQLSNSSSGPSPFNPATSIALIYPISKSGVAPAVVIHARQEIPDSGFCFLLRHEFLFLKQFRHIHNRTFAIDKRHDERIYFR
jgi:hypothetical protein